MKEKYLDQVFIPKNSFIFPTKKAFKRVCKKVSNADIHEGVSLMFVKQNDEQEKAENEGSEGCCYDDEFYI